MLYLLMWENDCGYRRGKEQHNSHWYRFYDCDLSEWYAWESSIWYNLLNIRLLCSQLSRWNFDSAWLKSKISACSIWSWREHFCSLVAPRRIDFGSRIGQRKDQSLWYKKHVALKWARQPFNWLKNCGKRHQVLKQRNIYGSFVGGFFVMQNLQLA